MDRFKIIAIDYDCAILEFLVDLLAVEGYDVQGYSGYEVDADCICQAKPDLVVLDLRRTEADHTLCLLDQLRRNDTTGATPVLMTSTDPRLVENLEVSLHRLGCITVLKPFDIQQFLDCVKWAMTWYGFNQSVEVELEAGA